MVELGQVRGRGRVLGGVRLTGEDDRVTTLQKPSARRCCSGRSWAWPRPSACGGCTSTWGRWRPSEHRLLEAHGQARARLALEAYTSGHFPIVAGIVLSALGVEGVLAHAEDTKPLGGFSGAALFGGVALYLAGYLLFKQRAHTASWASRGWSQSACSWLRCRPRSSSHRWSLWCSSWPL
jgi:Bacterial low temperature requirement A protein (LtrA)